MNVYLKFKVDLDESRNVINIKLIRSNGVPKGRLQSVEVVAEENVKIWPWSGMFSLDGNVASKMRRMLAKYFKRRELNKYIEKSCQQFSREEYNLHDQKTVDFLRSKGVKV